MEITLLDVDLLRLLTYNLLLLEILDYGNVALLSFHVLQISGQRSVDVFIRHVFSLLYNCSRDNDI